MPFDISDTNPAAKNLTKPELVKAIVRAVHAYGNPDYVEHLPLWFTGDLESYAAVRRGEDVRIPVAPEPNKVERFISDTFDDFFK